MSEMREIRESRGLTQAELAAVCLERGTLVHISAIYRYESTGKGIGTRNLLAIAEALGCEIEDLMSADK